MRTYISRVSFLSSNILFFSRSSENDGFIFTTTLRQTVIIVPSTISTSKSHNTAAIAGGAAAGIIAVAAAIIIFLFYWRRKRNREEEEYAGNFDPDRVVRQAGQSDLPGSMVTPYNYQPPPGALSGTTSPTFSGDGSMQQSSYRDSQGHMGSGYEGPTATSSGSQHAPTSGEGLRALAPPGSSSQTGSNSYEGAGLAPGFPVTQPYRPLSSKEAEALRLRGEGGLGVASTLEEGEGDIIQHSDGGHIAEPVPPSRPPQEIPPSYFSISESPF